VGEALKETFSVREEKAGQTEHVYMGFDIMVTAMFCCLRLMFSTAAVPPAPHLAGQQMCGHVSDVARIANIFPSLMF
jgi:hypothetical protein